MPYRRTYRRKRRTRRSSRASIYGKAGSQLWKDVKTLKNLINVEFKTADLQTTSLSVPNTGVLTLLNGLQQGDDFNRRSGRQVRWKSLQWRLRLDRNAAATNQRVRMIIFIDKMPREVAPTTANLLDISIFQGLDAFRQLDARKRFVILKDKSFILNSDRPQLIVSGFKKLDMKTVFDASNVGDISDIYSNALYVLFISDSSTNLPLVNMGTRLRFIDN